MSGSIHKEALADAKKLREIAELNARNAILEQITPTIKKMIEEELLEESTILEDEMEEDVLISPEKSKEEKKSDDDKEEVQNESESNEDVQLTNESIQTLANMASSKAEHYGIRALRISNKLDSLHEAKINESTYGEKLRQIKNEIEKTFKSLQEDKDNNIVPVESSQLIEGKLEELWEITNKLMIPVKVRLINESNKKIAGKIGQFKTIAKEYGLTKEAKNRFGKECIKLTKETKALLESVTELKEVLEDNTVDKVENRVSKLFKEIYTMAKKFGSLNEEELKIVISGLDTEDPEGSALTAMLEPAEEDELGDDMDMDDMDDMGAGEELGGDEMDYDMDEYEMYESEGAMDELGMGGSYKPADSGLGKSRRGGARKHLSPEEREAQERRGAELQAKEKSAMAESEGDDEVLEISEAMLKQELLRLKKQRAAMNEEAKAMQHSPGNGPDHFDNFGGAGRELGGGVEGESFTDSDSSDLNELDPVGGGFPVNENEESLDELLGTSYKAGGGSGRTGRSRAARGRLSPEDEKKQREKSGDEDSSMDEVNHELYETVKKYKTAIVKLRKDSKKLEEQLRKSNITNAKLVFATKLLQNENLSEKQRHTVVEQLEQAKSVREVKKLYTALKEALEGKSDKSKLTESAEGRPILGGSSRPSKPGASMLTEAEKKEFTRWGELAGFLGE